MKHTILYIMVSVALTLVAACSKPAGDRQEMQPVTVYASIAPEITVRSLSDGVEVDQVVCAAYIGGSLITTASGPVVDGEATVILELARSKQYDIVMWATCGSCEAWSFEPETATVTADYSQVTASSADFDAFWYKGTLEVDSDEVHVVELRRAVSQVYVGTSAAGDITDVNLSLTGIPSKWNLLTGKLSGADDVTFGLGAAPAGETFTISGVQYRTAAMVCLLSAETNATTDVAFSLKRDETPVAKSVANVVYRRNWCTRIAGDF